MNAPASSQIRLRPYQQEALDAIDCAEAAGVRRQLVALPTGTGKTVVFAHLLRHRRGPALVLAHREELIDQAAAKILVVDPGAGLGICKAERDDWRQPVTVASIQTIAQSHRLGRIPPGRYRTIVVDECHHATAESYRRVLEHFGAFSDDGPLTVGFTATPERADEAELGEVFQRIVYRRDIETMIREGYLCDLRAVQVQVAVDCAALRVSGGDYEAGELGAALEKANAPEHAAGAYAEHARGRKALVFTPTIALAHAMAEAFRGRGVRAEALSGETPPDERRAILRRLTSGETEVLANCAVLTEGYDEPGVGCVVVARPTRSRPLYIQMIGRGTRTFPGKRDCLILDLVGASSRHRLVTAATLFNVDPDRLSAAGAAEALRERDAPGPRIADTGPADGQRIAREVSLFGRERLNRWEPLPDGGWTMSVAGREVWIEPGRNGWIASVSGRGGTRILGSGLTAEYAQGVAEDCARSLLRDVFADQGAPWRARRATPSQIAMLHRFRIHPPPGLTAGEASDMIAAAIESFRRRRSA